MFVAVFWMNQHLSSTWILLELEVIAGIIYIINIYIKDRDNLSTKIIERK